MQYVPLHIKQTCQDPHLICVQILNDVATAQYLLGMNIDVQFDL